MEISEDTAAVSGRKRKSTEHDHIDEPTSPSADSDIPAEGNDTFLLSQPKGMPERIRACFTITAGGQKRQCNECHKNFAINSSGTTLQYHIRSGHPIVWNRMKDGIGVKPAVPQAFQRVEITQKKLSKAQQKCGEQLCVNVAVDAVLPFRLFERPSFKNLSVFLNRCGGTFEVVASHITCISFLPME